MMYILSVMIALSALSPRSGETENCNVVWSLDKPSVLTGGCVTLILQKPHPPVSNLFVSVGNRKDVSLATAGLSIDDLDATLFVLWCDFPDSANVAPISGKPEMLHLRPLFDAPEELTVTLMANHGACGAKTLIVNPAPPESRRAIEMLYPALEQDNPAVRCKARWWELIATLGANHTSGEPICSEQLHEELTTVAAHADWAEIVPLLVAYGDLRSYVKDAVAAAGHDTGTALRRLSDDAALPKTLEGATRANPTTRLGRAILRNIQLLLHQRENMAQHLRG